jgi:hypothetical protein
MPPTDTCIKEISKNQPGSAEVEIFIDILKSCEKNLGGFPSVTPYKIQGCLAHEDLMRDLLATFSSISHNTLSGHILSPRITMEQLKSELETLFKLKESCQNDIIQLNNVLAQIEAITNKWIEYLTKHQLQVREDFDEKIAEIRPEVEANVRDYQQKLNYELHSIEMSTTPMISTLESQISRLRMEEEMYKKQEETYKKINNPAAAEGARKMKDNVKKIRQKTEDQLKQVIENKKRQIKMITDNYNKLIEKEWERIRSLESERDNIFNLLERKKTEISKLVDNLRDKISKLVNSKTSIIGSIEEVGTHIPSEIEEQFGECFHLLMPLIIACLQGEKSRYVIIPPSVIKEKGTLRITKSLFGGIALPLEPITERFEKIAKRFEEMLKADSNLEKEISTMGHVNDILHLQETKELLAEGLKELRNLSLINDKQFQEITSAYEEYWRAILK